MELRQLRYFVKVVELGSMGRAALELNVVTSTLSQQISRLEGELATRLLQRTSVGVLATDAGMAFWRHAQLILRQVDTAGTMTREGRLSGQVSIGMSATTSSVLALPLVEAMNHRYPNVKLHLIEALSGHLSNLLNARQLDLAIIFDPRTTTRCTAIPLLEEELFVVGKRGLTGMPTGRSVKVGQLKALPLVLPSGSHTLRSLVLSAFERAQIEPNHMLQVDGMAIVIDIVRAGICATVLPGSAMCRLGGDDLCIVRIADPHLRRVSVLTSLSDDELSPAGLAARVVLAELARSLVMAGTWRGAALSEEVTYKRNASTQRRSDRNNIAKTARSARADVKR